MKHALVATLALCLVGTESAPGQDNETESVLDRIVTALPNGRPFVLAPPIPTFSDEAVLQVGAAAGVVVGFEAAPEVERMLVPLTEERRAEIASRRKIPLPGKTVRQALDTIVAMDQRYRWIDVHGVPVVRPWASWVDSKHLLNQVVGAVDWPETNLSKALLDIETLMTGTVSAGPIPGADRAPFFHLRTGPIAIMELLNAAAMAHSRAAWQVRHRCSPNDPRALQLQLMSYDRDNPPGVVTSCRNLSRER